jgi:hypothetical protein
LLHYLSISYRKAYALVFFSSIGFRDLTNEGVYAWDPSIMEEVLVTSTVLCFLGDSPMHAEITSTPVPANCLHPCRSCDLSSKSVRGKATMEYLQDFCMLSSSGEWVCGHIVLLL